ncbi:ribosomal-protein-alanine N-acetyltransferase [Rhizomicrobium palustre]|uniref:Ribosomal-protein-alanine N-acetyltransferase n=1 Tax=Rhizomicrobium palustre TaxID=189966 RepID=A0A846MX44_9PROT|nr:GNAT family N-acetyltransferase [Rhizomicrobium palustre]NIK88128.1 ribosomal-protein-alanine N-acetyltransferase [Rhizomicrobium palustre]
MITTDTALLSRLHAQCFEEVWSEKSFADLLAVPGTFALIDEAAAGFLLLQVVADQSEVLTLGVTPAARRRGIACELLAKALELAQEKGASHMLLEVESLNFQAIGLYRKYGFLEVGRRKAYYRHADGRTGDALMMRVEIHALRVGNRLQLG